MSGRGFASVFGPDLDAYLDFKTQMGFTGASRGYLLATFDAYCATRGLTRFDRAAVEGWVTHYSQSSGACRSWMSYIRDFGRWLRIHGNENAYVLSDDWVAGYHPPQPYLLTAFEIDTFFTATTRLDAASPWQWQATAFFTLMHSCGLRTGETRSLAPGDIDLSGQRIDIRDSKGHASRRLPISGEVADILASCGRQTRRRFPAPRATFFISSRGNKTSPCTVPVIFRRIWEHAGLAWPDHGKHPRPYDLRHHFAYANIERWARAGNDVNARMPYLSRYMGHATLESTYYYVHTSPDFMAAYAGITAEQGRSVLPEAGFE